ncbi:MAG: sugar transferase [Candidatus Limivicinus sp.]
MYRRDSKSWLKHLDFMVLDLIILQISFVLSYMLRHGLSNPFDVPVYANMGFFLIFSDLLIIFFVEPFRNILKRGYFVEMYAVLQQTVLLELSAMLFLFATKAGSDYSRLSMLYMAFLYAGISYPARIIRKRVVKKNRREGGRSLLVITDRAAAPRVIDDIRQNNYGSHRISGLVLLDGDDGLQQVDGVPVVADKESALGYVQKAWIDEVFICASGGEPLPGELMTELAKMGITMHLNLDNLLKAPGRVHIVENFAGHRVITSGMNYATTRQALFKRSLDIAGGLVGCVFTVILSLFVAPAIYIASPGPIFFTQERIGKNGKRFKMYKFRSMYMDAEERKKDLMSQNKLGSDLMFKLDFDPRIIGNRILPDGTKKTGIGQFIRSTSIDEFPQFFNVLKGDMSLVGTRPPLVSEFDAYEPHHRARMSVKPGITGLWQVSGRSEITDFEEVVRLDTEYINNWSLGLDFRILFQTVGAVIRRKGSA